MPKPSFPVCAYRMSGRDVMMTSQHQSRNSQTGTTYKVQSKALVAGCRNDSTSG